MLYALISIRGDISKTDFKEVCTILLNNLYFHLKKIIIFRNLKKQGTKKKYKKALQLANTNLTKDTKEKKK